MNKTRKPVSATLLFALLLAGAICRVSAQFIEPGNLWLDDRGMHIQAHGGGMLKLGDTWYWFGEDYSPSNDPDKRYIACYSSTNLVNWTFRNQVVQLSDPANLGPGWVLQRPKVFYNANTRQYVMYMHLDDAEYSLARVATATCDTVDGNYTYERSFRPLGFESRDIGQFVDDDGTAYLIFEDRPHGFHIAQLSDDYLSLAADVCLITNHLEAGALIHYDGLYYVVGSHLTGWAPNPNQYATATNLAGPWSEFKDIAPPDLNTYNSQSTMLLKVVGSNTTAVIFMGDMWNSSALWDSRYLWLPLEIGGGNLSLPEPQNWAIDIGSGETMNEPPPVENPSLILSGAVIGTPGSWENLGNTITNVFDNDLTTYFDGPNSSNGSNCWAGLDFGAGVTHSIGEIRYCPRTDYANLMVNGKFQGANQADFSDAETLLTVTIQPPTNILTTRLVFNQKPFRYVRYLSPPDGWGNVSEVQFVMPPPKLTCSLQGDQLSVTWSTDYAEWRLEAQTDPASTNWWEVVGPNVTNSISMPITGEACYFRLVYP